MPEEKTEPTELIFDPSLISSQEPDNPVEPKEEKLNLFKDDLFDDKVDDAPESDEKEVEGTPSPEDIKKEDKSSETSVFSVVLGQSLQEKGVISNFDEDKIAKIAEESGEAEALTTILSDQAKSIKDELVSSYDENYQNYLQMLEGGVSKEEATGIQQLESFSASIKNMDLKAETDESAQARKDLLTLNYRLTTKWSEDKIQREVGKLYDSGDDLVEIEEAAVNMDSYIAEEKDNAIKAATKQQEDIKLAHEKQTNDLLSFVDKTEEYFKGEKVTPEVKAKMKKLLTTPTKSITGNTTSELWAERDKDTVSFDSKIAHLVAIGYFNDKPFDKFVKNATTKAATNLESYLNDNKGRNYMKSTGRSFTKDTASKVDFLDF